MNLEDNIKAGDHAPRGISRRQFIQTASATAAGVFGAPYFIRAEDLGVQKLRIAYVAVGGQAGAHTGYCKPESKIGHCVAYADVDRNQWNNMKHMGIDAPSYTDWRKMFDNHMKEIDAVFVTTPDHSHATPTIRAIKEGKAVYTEKPLTWCISEARAIAEATAEHKVATQMGNMGHANEGNRRVVEWIRDGAIGDVQEVHTFTNRPVWPQGNLTRVLKPTPPNLDWDNWIGPAPYRDYQDGLHQFAWRGWFDFGCGAVGDMGCHTWDCVFWSMNPDYPSSTEQVKIITPGKESFPAKSHFKWTFPAKGNRPGFEAHWYSGGLKPDAPEEFLNDPARQRKDANGNPVKPKLPDSGSIFIGTKGKLLVEGDYGDSPRLIPESAMQAYMLPPKLARSIGHHEEFFAAAKGEKPWDYPGSNFAKYAGPLTEVMLLGSLNERIGQVGFKIECDAVGRTITTPEAAALVTRVRRPGFEL